MGNLPSRQHADFLSCRSAQRSGGRRASCFRRLASPLQTSWRHWFDHSRGVPGRASSQDAENWSSRTGIPDFRRALEFALAPDRKVRRMGRSQEKWPPMAASRQSAKGAKNGTHSVMSDAARSHWTKGACLGSGASCSPPGVKAFSFWRSSYRGADRQRLLADELVPETPPRDLPTWQR